MNNTLSYLVQSISRKLLLVKSNHLGKKQTELVDEMLDTDIVELQGLLKWLKSLSDKEIKEHL